MINGDRFERSYPINTYKPDEVKIGRLDDQGNVVEYVDLSSETGMGRLFTDFAETRSESGLYRVEDLQIQATFTVRATGTINKASLLLAIEQIRQVQAQRKLMMDQIRLWVNDVRGGDPAPLDAMYEIAAQFLLPEDMTWEHLNMRFVSTDHAWLNLEMALTGAPEATAMACKCILYLMGREGEDGHGHV